MKNLNLILVSCSFIFVTTATAQVPQLPEVDWSHIYKATHGWLYQDLENTQTLSDDSLGNFYALSVIASHGVLYGADSSWKVQRVSEYDIYGNEIKPNYQDYKLSNSGVPSIYAPSSAYNYIYKKTEQGYSSLMVLRADHGSFSVSFHNKDTVEALLLIAQMREYHIEKNPYRFAILELIKDPKIGDYAIGFMSNIEDYKYTWNDLILDAKLKKNSFDLTEGFLAKSDLLTKNKISFKQGILLSGPPGTGKSFLAQILISQILNGTLKKKATLFVVTARHLDSHLNISKMMTEAGTIAPTALFMEDVDLFGVKNRDNQQGNAKSETLLNELLNGIDGLIENNQVLVVGTTNRVDLVDNALTRSQRLGYHLYYGLPSFEERLEFFRRFGKKHAEWESELTDVWLAGVTEGYSGSDIIELIRLAKRDALIKGSMRSADVIILNREHFNAAISLMKEDHKANTSLNAKLDQAIFPSVSKILKSKLNQDPYQSALIKLNAFEAQLK
jgi:ATP-dependent 26S proteasome regulatory subunit